MSTDTINIIFIIIGALAVLVGIKRGYKRGIGAELKMLIGVAVSFLCLLFILVLSKALKDQTYGTVLVVAGALLILGVGWRILKLILGPLSGLRELGLVRVVDSLLGAAAGAIEGAALTWIALKIFMMLQT